MKYESELIKEIVDTRGHGKSSLHYQSECVKNWVNEAKGGYPKLTEYQAEWLNYIVEHPIGKFPYETLSDVTEATVDNVVPYAYRSAILKGSTKYRDIDTGEVLDAFEDGRNLELVSVKMPVLKTYNDNPVPSNIELTRGNHYQPNMSSDKTNGFKTDYIYYPNKVNEGEQEITLYVGMSYDGEESGHNISYYRIFTFDKDKNHIETIGFEGNRTKTKSDFEYIQISFLNYDSTFNIDLDKVSNIWVNTENVGYAEHKSNILTVNEEVELRGIGDVKDTLDCLTGEVVERIGEIVLDGSEDEVWVSSREITINGVAYGQYYLTSLVIPSNNYIGTTAVPTLLCDKGVTDAFNGLWMGGSIKTISLRELNGKYHLCMNFPLNEDIKLWLQQNHMTLYYQLEKESIKTVDLTVKDQDGNTLSRIKPIEGTMHLSTTGTPIKPTFNGEIPVEATNQNLASFIKE